MAGGSSSVRGKRKIHKVGAACGGRKASSADKDIEDHRARIILSEDRE